MTTIEEACRSVVLKTDGALAAGVVDLECGALLGVHNAIMSTPEMNALGTAATQELFRNSNIERAGRLSRAMSGLPDDGAPYFQEMHLTSAQHFHLATALKGGRAAIVLITRRTANLGMAWAQLKAAIPVIEPLLPIHDGARVESQAASVTRSA